MDQRLKKVCMKGLKSNTNKFPLLDNQLENNDNNNNNNNNDNNNNNYNNNKNDKYLIIMIISCCPQLQERCNNEYCGRLNLLTYIDKFWFAYTALSI